MGEDKTKIAIVGWGNVGRGVYEAIKRNSDMELTTIFSRDPNRVFNYFSEKGMHAPNLKNLNYSVLLSAAKKRGEVDVAILCGGSAKDLPEQGPEFAKYFNTVDSFDTHAKIPEYFAKMNEISTRNKGTSIISAGWDPGTFSLERVLGDAFIPGSVPKGFYGLSSGGGLSMGHSDALRTIKGVKDARQYTHASQPAIDRIKAGENPKLTPREMHWRDCYVVLENDNPDERKRVKNEIKTMKNYFEPYETMVAFVNQGQLNQLKGMPHDGVVITSGKTGKGNEAMIEYRNQWASNPEATGSILIACARACHKFNNEKKFGVYTMLDIPAAYFSPRSQEELLKDFM